MDVLPGGSTASLGLEWKATTLRNSGQLSVGVGALERIAVYPYAANGRFIYGTPSGGSLTVTTDDFGIGFDGRSWRFRIEVH